MSQRVLVGTRTEPAKARGPEPGRRRRATRRPARLEVECVVGRIRYTARTLDLSRHGIRLELTDPRLAPPQAPSGLAFAAANLTRRLGNGFRVEFSHGVVRAQASLVRAELPRHVGEPYRVGCQFHLPLEAQDCRLLGVTGEGDYEP